MPPTLLRVLPVVLLTSVALPAQTPPAPPPPAPAAAPAETRQFDFWIGEWEVTTPDGKLAGTSKIEPIARGRGLLENWTGAGAGAGKSLNAYNPAKKQWQQFWVGADGTVLELAGGLDARGAMVLTGETAAPPARLHRITWTPQPDGTVRQRWEISRDAGQTWQVAFDALYRKKQ